MGMNWTRTSYLFLVMIMISVGVTSAYAITITLGADPVVILGILDMSNNKITNVGTPTLATDAATKGYVDSGSPGSGTVTSVGSGTGLTGGPITGSGSLSIDTAVVPQLGAFNTFQNDMTVDGNLLVTEGSFTVDQQAFFNNNIDLTGTSAADNDVIFFDDGASTTLQWDNTDNRFEFNRALHVNGGLNVFEGSITTNIDGNFGGNVNVDGNLDLTGNSAIDDDIIFFDEGTFTTLQWDNTDNQFEFSRKLDVNGGLSVREGTFTSVDASTLSGQINLPGVVNLGNNATLTIDGGGAVSPFTSFHAIAPNTGTSDFLDTINGGIVGDFIIIKPASEDFMITVRNGTGNIMTEAGVNLLLDFFDHAGFIFDGTNWNVIFSSNPGV